MVYILVEGIAESCSLYFLVLVWLLLLQRLVGEVSSRFRQEPGPNLRLTRMVRRLWLGWIAPWLSEGQVRRLHCRLG